MLDEIDGEGTLGDVSTGLSGQLDGLASKVTEDNWISFENEREERLSELGAIGTGDGGFQLIVVTGEGEGFDNCRVRTVHSEHFNGEWFGVTEKMKGEGARVVFGESSKVRMTMGV